MAVKPLWDTQKLNLANGLIAVQTLPSKTLTRGGRNNMGSLKLLTALPLVGLLAACGSAAGNSNNANGAPVSAMAVTATAVTAPDSKLGAVLATVQYWDGSRPFMNMIYGGSWQMAGANGAEDLPKQYLDANGWIKSLPAGYRAYRGISFPTAGGNFIGGRLASLYGSMPLPQLFGLIAGVGIGGGLIMFALTPPIKRLMGDVN